MSLLAGCGTFPADQDGAPEKILNWDEIPDAVPRVEPLSETGNPASYAVDGKRYFIDFNVNDFRQRGAASWYGAKFHGRKTSSGEVYDMYAMTAAHKTLPLPTYVKVRNLHNEKQVIVKINDRGPFVDGRIIDLSYAAAQKLDIVNNGTADVEIETVFADGARKQIDKGQPDTDNSRLETARPDDGTNTTAAVYYVQLGAFSHRPHAEKLLLQLTSQAITPVSISRKNDTDNSLFRVRVGPFADRQALHNMESQLSELGYTSSYIVTE
ncbi:MAG: septal ring lytic transglycosylase RlpA family protein [Gammaproteobacteria bacterium]|nr:septal ring lytic transglycosylase RlpA family protein [Gammaproteobacteria bacterium]